MYAHIHVCENHAHMLSHACGGHKNTLDVRFHLLPCVRRDLLLFAAEYARLADP